MTAPLRVHAAAAAVFLCFAPSLGWAGTEGGSSTFYGQNAGASNSGGGDDGYNTFIGFSAGNSNVSGIFNVYIGHGAGDGASGSYGTFVGRYTGRVSSGSYNTFLGYGAGQFNTTGAGDTVERQLLQLATEVEKLKASSR
jgi:hypothetical protein